MWAALVLAAVGQVAPGPLDAFRANYASIRVSVEYEFEGGPVGAGTIRSPRFWKDGRPTIRKSRTVTRGRWACDGTTEYFLVNSDHWNAAADEAQLNEDASIDLVEALWRPGDQWTAWHERTGPRIEVLQLDSPPVLSVGTSPFYWWGPEPFPNKLDYFLPSEVQDEVRRVEWEETPVEVVNYYKTFEGRPNWVQLEIGYDPSVGFLPRVGRIASHGPSGTVLSEFFLVEARACRDGGFIPVEWYETIFRDDHGRGDATRYRLERPLNPRGEVYLTHFLARKVEDLEDAVALERLDGATALAAPGGEVTIPDGTRRLTLARIESLLGPRLNAFGGPSLPSLAIDHEAINRYENRSGSGWGTYAVVGSGALLLVLTLLLIRRRFKTICLIAFCSAGAGCENRVADVTSPPPQLAVAFKSPVLFFEAPQIESSVILENRGVVPTRVFRADGGCSCRRIDQDAFPFVLNPGQRREIGIALDNQRLYGPRQYPFSIDTDHGSIELAAMATVLARSTFSPDSISFKGFEEEAFHPADFVFRTVCRAGEETPEIEMVAPDGINLHRLGVDSGPVAFAPDFRYEDATYRVDLDHRELGIHKDYIRVLGPDGSDLHEIPVVWQRVPFLHSSPDRALLGARPVRVFLRCPDETVELTRVVSAPEGVNAVVSSVRELTVMLTEDAPEIIDGFIEVATTAEDRPPLRVPVVRYAPSIASEGRPSRTTDERGADGFGTSSVP